MTGGVYYGTGERSLIPVIGPAFVPRQDQYRDRALYERLCREWADPGAIQTMYEPSKMGSTIYFPVHWPEVRGAHDQTGPDCDHDLTDLLRSYAGTAGRPKAGQPFYEAANAASRYDDGRPQRLYETHRRLLGYEPGGDPDPDSAPD